MTHPLNGAPAGLVPDQPDPEPVGAVIVAAGAGRRFGEGGGVRKQYRLLRGSPVLAWSIAPFLNNPRIGPVVVVLPSEDASSPPDWLRHARVHCVAGGAERGDSVRNGLAALPPRVRAVLIHDGARPLTAPVLIDSILDALAAGVAVIPGIPIDETLKEVAPDGTVLATVDRGRYWRVQTPQAFPRDALEAVHERARGEGFQATDDAALFERYGIPVRIVRGDPQNLKVTTPHDLEVAGFLARTLPPPFGHLGAAKLYAETTEP